MPDIEALIEDAKKLAVVEPGKGEAKPKPTRVAKVVAAKEEKVIPPPSAEEKALVRVVCARMMKSEEHFVSLSIELAKLRTMVAERGDKWADYCHANLKNPKSGEPYGDRVIRQYVRLGNEGEGDPEKVLKLFYEIREKAKESMKKVRAKQKTAQRYAGRKNGGANADDLQIFCTYFHKGKVREDSSGVTVTWGLNEWRNLQSSLKILTGE